jgi:toxin ParE1/3/4
MKLVFSRQALADLDAIASYYSANASPAIASSVERRIIDVIERIRRAPEAAPRVAQRPRVRAVAVIRYPFRIFYRPRGDAIEILHIRHTSRQPVTDADQQ